jgi:surface antigen-like variable number repeat protein
MKMSLTDTQRSRPVFLAILASIVLLACTGIEAQDQNHGKIDQFGDVNEEDAMARLDRFALELQSHPDSRGIIVASNTTGRNVPRGTFLRMAYGYQNYLVKSRGIPAERISVVEGERKPATRFELWTLPRNELSTISEEANTPEPSSPQLFDSLPIGPETQCVGELPIELYKLEDGLRILSDALVHHARAKTWIVVHPRTIDSQAVTRGLINRSRQLLIRNGVKAQRILTAVGSPRGSICGEVRLWMAPANSAKADEAAYYSQLLADAESPEYSVRRVEFVGLKHLRDGIVRKGFVQQEGDVFSRKLLEQSLKNFNSLGSLYPVTLDDVEARLDREEKLIDLTIYFRERRRP